MMYAHTIAIAKSLLADGHTEEVRQMLRPLIGRSAHGAARSKELKNNRMMLRALLVQAILLDECAQEEAFTYLGQDAAVSKPRTLAEAALKLWRGWALLSIDRNDQHLPEAVCLMREAGDFFTTHARTDCLHWSALGLARAYLNRGDSALAEHHLHRAKQVLAVLEDALATCWLQKLQSGFSAVKASDAVGLDASNLPLHVVAHAPGMNELLCMATVASSSTSPVLISGERGTGKSRIARLIHRQAGHAAAQFHTICCTGSSSSLPIDQVFADHFHNSNELRTLYLQHVEQLPLAAQKNIRNCLLGFFESETGQRKTRSVRIIASASSNLLERVQKNVFDQALYQSLQFVRLQLEPLRNRRGDIPLLARHFVQQLRPAGIPFAAITEDAIEALVAYNWPGNVRQLRNEIERALVHIGQEPFPVIDVDDLSLPIQSSTAPAPGTRHHAAPAGDGYQLEQILSTTECSIIERALSDHKGQVAAAANALGLTRQGLYKKMKRLGINASHTSQLKAPPHVASTIERY